MHIYIEGLSRYLKKKKTEDFEMRMETRAVNLHIYLYLKNLYQLIRDIKNAIFYSYLFLYC